MRGGGVEPPPRKPGPAPQTDASTNSAIRAKDIQSIPLRTMRLIRTYRKHVNVFFRRNDFYAHGVIVRAIRRKKSTNPRSNPL